MRTIAFVAILVAMLGTAGLASAQVNVTVNPANINLGYMNVFELPGNGGGYVFGQPWGFVDLTAVYSGNDLTLGATPIGDPDPFWYIGGGAPGAAGNKIMEAAGYAQVDGTYAGQTVVFSGSVTDYSFTEHSVTAFIRDFASDFSSFNEQSQLLTGVGGFAISLATIPDPGRHVQYGFRVVGVNAWPTDTGQFGTVTIAPDMAVAVEETSWSRVKSLY